jgi:hypothetical protein
MRKMMTREELIGNIAEHLMFATRGYKSKNDWPIEWDKNNEDSQISMVMEDVQEVISFLEKSHGLSFNNTVPTPKYSVWSSSVPLVTQTPETEVKITISSGVSPTVEDLENFVYKVKELEGNPDTRVSGSVTFETTFTDVVAGKISCGDCESEDVIVSVHLCNSLNDN